MINNTVNQRKKLALAQSPFKLYDLLCNVVQLMKVLRYMSWLPQIEGLLLYRNLSR